MTPRQKQDPVPGEVARRVPDGPYELMVTVARDKRLRTSARWSLNGDTIAVRVPASIRREQLDTLLDDIVAHVLKQRMRARRQHDDDLEQRAQAINRRYFEGELSWHTIRWVSNMARRLGSCTSGGSTDGDIRISDRIRAWPDFVIDYVIAHELAHRKYPHHGSDFWAYLARYPHLDRARGFIEGVAYGSGADPDSLI